MVRERAVAYDSSSEEGSSSCSSSEETSKSSLSSSSSSSSSTGSSGADGRPKRSRVKSRHTSRRNSSRKRRRQECTSRERRKKRERLCYEMEPKAKYEEKRQRKRSRKSKSEMPMEGAKAMHSSKKRGSNKLHEFQEDTKLKDKSYNSLEEAMNMQEQQKALIRQSAEIAKARLESGELQRARDHQRKMHQLYGAVDWRANKKLRTEKKMLERTVAAGKRLASLEQREYARMDAFRVALGLPTAEAQRQAEWRKEATQALLDLENGSKASGPPVNHRCQKPKHGVIGPRLPT